MANWRCLENLRSGSQSQNHGYKILTENKIFEKLKDFNPVLAGTIPLGIDIESSDLDVICHVEDFEAFAFVLNVEFSKIKGFQIRQKQLHLVDSIICRFFVSGKLIEIVGQNIPVENQMAYRHMLIEYEILKHFGFEFKQKIIDLKKQGIKTEPAFAQLLGLIGDPYEEILNFRITD